ncbi:unnamed protein product [Rotaria socialis]|uniref:Uncharacterized protein n=2 Tax=Rotaria socialis TaxID=392032 RepID=A0A818M5I7_9BILA|nr:unnamed protein product [Rotaria socialis]
MHCNVHYFLKSTTWAPEASMTRIKYWINEYPIIIQDLKILNKQLYSQAYLETSNFDADDFFNNSQTVISLFLETGPEKENWFHKLSLVIRKSKDELERVNRVLMGAPSVNLPVTSPTINKREENLERLLDSPSCLGEAAITLKFLTRRLFCDIFEESLFNDLMKEKIELKLKEIAVCVLEDLHVGKIDLAKNVSGYTQILQPLLSYSPDNDQPMYGQHQSIQTVHKDDRKLDNDDLLQRQKLSAKEPEIPENGASRKLGTLLTKLATNKHFQRFAALKPVVGVIEKLSNAELGANVELTSFSGIMTINISPPPNDRIWWIDFPEMPDLSLKVTPVFGENKYSYSLIHAFLERMAVLACMDDQLLSIFRDWVIDAIAEIASKPGNPLIGSYESQTSFRDKIQDNKELNHSGSPLSDTTKSNSKASL